MQLKIAKAVALRKQNWKRVSDTELSPLLPSLAFFSLISQVLFQNDLSFSASLILTGRRVVFNLFLHLQCSHILLRLIFIE